MDEKHERDSCHCGRCVVLLPWPGPGLGLGRSGAGVVVRTTDGTR
jgi:hypothetical protein